LFNCSNTPDTRRVLQEPETRSGASKSFWKAMLVSFFLIWGLDILTSATLISGGFGFLEYNAFVLVFFQAPTWPHFLLFGRDQILYFIPLLLAVSAPVVERLTKGQSGDQVLYLPTAIILFLYALDRLNLGVASNAANLIAIVLRESVPASSVIFYILWVVLDGLWAAAVWRYVRGRKD
jgi:hypothetical protein